MDPDKRLRSVSGTETDASRVLATLLFTDLVGSTERAAELGDRRWRALLERHHSKVREELDRFQGREMDCAGDGFFATFATASEAVGCGLALTRSLASFGLEARVGLHTGECERFERKLSGVAVHTAARVVGLARPHEVLVTTTVQAVVAGSGLEFEERGAHTLKGLPGVWHLYAAVARDAEDRPAGGERTHAPRRRTHPAGRLHTVGPQGR